MGRKLTEQEKLYRAHLRAQKKLAKQYQLVIPGLLEQTETKPKKNNYQAEEKA